MANRSNIHRRHGHNQKSGDPPGAVTKAGRFGFWDAEDPTPVVPDRSHAGRAGSRKHATAAIVDNVLKLAGLVSIALFAKEKMMPSYGSSPGAEGRRRATQVEEPAAPTREYPHDHPDHPWHWTRASPPDAALGRKEDCAGASYASLYRHFHEYGYAIFTSCSLLANRQSVLVPAAEFTKTEGRRVTETEGRARIQNGANRAVREISYDADTLEFLQFVHGGERRPFPFQTLNFPTGTQQSIHSDLIHFDTMPRTLMTAAWTALEDMSEDNGPLKFYPRSHHLGTLDWEEIGLRQKKGPEGVPHDVPKYFGEFYGEELVKYLEKAGLRPHIASDMKFGQTLVWAAGLAHGGSDQRDRSLTRLSQVTHYFFEGADYYWVPRLSKLTEGEVRYIKHLPGCKTSPFAPEGAYSCAEGHLEKWKNEF